MVAPTTTLVDVFTGAEDTWAPTTADFDAWQVATNADQAVRLRSSALGAAITGVEWSVGLFGADLTSFLDDCTTVDDTTICDPADYAAYTGWGLGVCFIETTAGTLTAADVDSILLADSLMLLEITQDDSENTYDYSTVTSADFDATEPTGSSVTDGFVDPFEAWWY